MGVLENRFKDNVIVASLDKFLGWARSTSPWYFQFGLACCAIEMMASVPHPPGISSLVWPAALLK